MVVSLPVSRPDSRLGNHQDSQLDSPEVVVLVLADLLVVSLTNMYSSGLLLATGMVQPGSYGERLSTCLCDGHTYFLCRVAVSPVSRCFWQQFPGQPASSIRCPAEQGTEGSSSDAGPGCTR